MNSSVAQITEQAACLDDQQRAALAGQLMLGIDDPSCRMQLRRNATIATKIADDLDQATILREQSQCHIQPNHASIP